MTTIREVLVSARARILNCENWINHGYLDRAQTASHEAVMPTDKRAARWSADGAIRASSSDPMAEAVAQNALHDAIGRHLFGSVSAWNFDRNTTHEMVVAAFDKAIGE